MVYTLTVQSLEAEITSMFRPSTAMPLTGRAWATENATSQSHTHSYTFIVSHKPLGFPNSPRWIPDCMLNISTWPVFIPIIAKLPQEVIVTHYMVTIAHIVSYQCSVDITWAHVSYHGLTWSHMTAHNAHMTITLTWAQMTERHSWTNLRFCPLVHVFWCKCVFTDATVMQVPGVGRVMSTRVACHHAVPLMSTCVL